MRGAEGIVGRFRPLGEARRSVLLSDRADAVPASGEDLVRIGLVADVPDDLVARRVEHRMQRDRQFHDAEARTEVATGLGHRRDRLGAQLVRDLSQLHVGERLEVGGGVDPVEKRGLWTIGHVGLAPPLCASDGWRGAGIKSAVR